MLRFKWTAAVLALVLVSGIGAGVTHATEKRATGTPPAPAGTMQRMWWRARGLKTGNLRISVRDAKTMKGIPGAGCVVTETGDRVETNAQGVAPTIKQPVFRNPRLEELLAELHGQLNVICYKNGYRDSIYMGVRMHENQTTAPEVWMYPIGQGDRRIEPTLFQMPIHRIWRIQLADKYRLRDEGEGPERPALTNPNAGVAPPEPQGGGIQTPIRPGPMLQAPTPQR